MQGPRILLVYGTRYGQTAKIASRLAAMLDESGCVVDMRDAAELPPSFPLEGTDGIIVGASVLFGRHQRSVERFVRAHRDALNGMPSAFFSVSGAAASTRPEGPVNARRQLEAFIQRTGWQPPLTRCVGGAIAYTEYGPLTRWLIRTIQAREGGPTDTSRDHESTDWEDVRRFAAAFLSRLPAVPGALVGATAAGAPEGAGSAAPRV